MLYWFFFGHDWHWRRDYSTPIILLFHWGNMKEAAAVSALFIWVNSAAGFTGHLISGFLITPQMFVLVIIAIIGGFLGSYWGVKK